MDPHLLVHISKICVLFCVLESVCMHVHFRQRQFVPMFATHTVPVFEADISQTPLLPPNKPRPLFKRCKSALIILQRLWKNLEIHSSTIIICFLKLLSNSVKFYFPWLHPVSKVLKEDNLPHYQMRFFCSSDRRRGVWRREGVYQETPRRRRAYSESDPPLDTVTFAFGLWDECRKYL